MLFANLLLKLALLFSCHNAESQEVEQCCCSNDSDSSHCRRWTRIVPSYLPGGATLSNTWFPAGPKRVSCFAGFVVVTNTQTNHVKTSTTGI